MKLKDLKPGKWYTSDNWRSGSYAKFLSDGDNDFKFSESIYKKEYRNIIDNWSDYNNYKEISISEIRHLLPKDYKFEEEMNYYFY